MSPSSQKVYLGILEIANIRKSVLASLAAFGGVWFLLAL